MKKDIGLFVLRVFPALIMLWAHGWGKLQRFSGDPIQFADPLGVGPTVSLVLTVFAEVVCSALLIIGYRTRWVAAPLFITMVVAALVVHSADPFATKEKAILFAIPFFVLMLTGGGTFSLDGFLGKRQ